MSSIDLNRVVKLDTNLRAEACECEDGVVFRIEQTSSHAPSTEIRLTLKALQKLNKLAIKAAAR